MVRSDRLFRFPVGPERLWEAIEQTEDYQTWWPWLRGLTGGGLVTGAEWGCHVQPPLPWSVRFRITLEEVVRPERAIASIAGDIRGTAELTVAAADGGCTARLVSDLAPASPVLRAAARAARPIVVWGHDWVLDRGAAQFAERGLPDLG